MKNTLASAFKHNVFFWIFGVVAIGLIIAGFIVPPTGVIDGSVLTATGEIFAFAALGVVIKAIDKGVDATLTHKDTVLTLTNDEVEA